MLMQMSFVFERHLDPCTVELDFAVLEVQVEFNHFGNPQIAQRFGSGSHCIGGSHFPRFFTGTYQFNNLVRTFWHGDDFFDETPLAFFQEKALKNVLLYENRPEMV